MKVLHHQVEKNIGIRKSEFKHSIPLIFTFKFQHTKS